MRIKYKDKNIDFDLDASRFIYQSKKAQIWLDNEVLKDTTPFLPFKTGQLEHSGVLGTRIGSGEIIYNTPYARRLYYNPQFNFSKEAHPKAQAYWFEASKSINKDKWIRGVRKIGGGG